MEIPSPTPPLKKKKHQHNHPWLQQVCGRSPLMYNIVHTLLHLFLTHLVVYTLGALGLLYFAYWLGWRNILLSTAVLGVVLFKLLMDKSQKDQQARCRMLVQEVAQVQKEEQEAEERLRQT
jgi:hypothetical protein